MAGGVMVAGTAVVDVVVASGIDATATTGVGFGAAGDGDAATFDAPKRARPPTVLTLRERNVRRSRGSGKVGVFLQGRSGEARS